jgi:ubiquinone/menaquinone biosynthesis C-methylase UbiE
MDDARKHWDRLHDNPRFRPLYPNDHVVRFLIANHNFAGACGRPRCLDIGTGTGRHMKLASELGLTSYGVDISLSGLKHTSARLLNAGIPPFLAAASMREIPFADQSFNLMISYGVFYYGMRCDMDQAIREVYRLLVPGGKAFIVLRTTNDYRFGKGEKLELNTFRLNIPDTNELNTVQHFLTAEDIPVRFSGYTAVSFEKTETTSGGRLRLDSDWLIIATK